MTEGEREGLERQREGEKGWQLGAFSLHRPNCGHKPTNSFSFMQACKFHGRLAQCKEERAFHDSSQKSSKKTVSCWHRNSYPPANPKHHIIPSFLPLTPLPNLKFLTNTL